MSSGGSDNPGPAEQIIDEDRLAFRSRLGICLVFCARTPSSWKERWQKKVIVKARCPLCVRTQPARTLALLAMQSTAIYWIPIP